MPTPKNPDLSALRLSNPEAFAKRINDCIVDNGGDVELAAKALGVSRRTMFRWRAEASRATTGKAQT